MNSAKFVCSFCVQHRLYSSAQYRRGVLVSGKGAGHCRLWRRNTVGRVTPGCAIGAGLLRSGCRLGVGCPSRVGGALCRHPPPPVVLRAPLPVGLRHRAPGTVGGRDLCWGLAGERSAEGGWGSLSTHFWGLPHTGRPGQGFAVGQQPKGPHEQPNPEQEATRIEWLHGMSGLQVRGGGGAIEPPKSGWAGGWEKGSIDRHHYSDELWRRRRRKFFEH